MKTQRYLTVLLSIGLGLGAVVELYGVSDGPAGGATKPRGLERAAANESGTVTLSVTDGRQVPLGQTPQITGTVLDPEGKPVSDVRVTLFPNRGKEKLTDAKGRFSLASESNPFGIIMARHVGRHLAATLDLDEDTTSVAVRLKPAVTLAGHVTDTSGKAVTNAELEVTVRTEHRRHSLGPPIAAAADGRFEIKALPTGPYYDVVVRAKGYGVAYEDLGKIVPMGRGQKCELKPFRLPMANRRIAGVVLDEEDKPAAGVSIYGQGDRQPDLNGVTDLRGRFSFDQVYAGAIRLFARGPTDHGDTFAESGDTNIIVRLGETQTLDGIGIAIATRTKVTGTVLDPEGNPAAKVLVSLLPFGHGEKTTDSQGRFTLTSDSRPPGDRVVIARDPARLLAAALELAAEATNAELRLEPAWTLAGRVVDTKGAAIPGAQAQAMFEIEGRTCPFGSPAPADTEGRFEIRALPFVRAFNLQISAPGFGQDILSVTPPEGNAGGLKIDPVALEGDGPRVELNPIELLAANERIAGVVIDADDKPVSWCFVHCYGPRQSNLSERTDSKGRFAFKQVCAGAVHLSIGGQRGEIGAAITRGGDTNIIVRVVAPGGRRPSPTPPTSLEGKPLPDLTPLGLTAEDIPANQRVLAVLIDAEQRPSWRVLKRLTELAGMLKEKGVAVVVLQAGALDGEAFAAWKQEAALPFPVGLLKGNRDKTRAAWGAAALPWLILTDTHRKVTDEGFAPGELDEKLASADK